MTIVDAIGFLAFALNVVGNLMLVYKDRWGAWGWAVRIVSIVCWGAYGIGDTSWPNVANAIVFFGINCWGVWKWRSDLKRAAAAAVQP